MEGVLILHQSDTPADDYHTVNTQFSNSIYDVIRYHMCYTLQ